MIVFYHWYVCMFFFTIMYSMFFFQVVQLTPSILGSLAILEWVCGIYQDRYGNETPPTVNITLMAKLPVNLSLVKPLEVSQDGGHIEYGPSISYCLSLYWKCILYTLQHSSGRVIPSPTVLPDGDKCSLIRIGSDDVESIAGLCLDYMDIVTVDQLATPLYCLATLLPKVHVHVLTCVRISKICDKNVQ